MILIYKILSFAITLTFILLGVFIFNTSYLRFGESCVDFFNSLKFYFCKLFNVDNNIHVTVNDYTKVFDPVTHSDIPLELEGFTQETTSFFELFIDTNNFMAYLDKCLNDFVVFSKVMVFILPIVIILGLIIKIVYNKPNNKYNIDTIPLKIYKRLSALIYEPIKNFIRGYIVFLKDHPTLLSIWFILWIFNLNIATIIVEFLAFYYYFAMSFDFRNMYTQIVKFGIDFKVIILHFSWWILLPIGVLLFLKFRRNIALNRLNHYEAKNCGFINSLPIVSMTCGSMGKKKTTVITDMALSQEVMFRQKAFDIIKNNDLKFPDFPWILFELDIRDKMENREIYNLASIRKWIKEKKESYFNDNDSTKHLYNYDTVKYPITFDDKLQVISIFDVLLNYAQAYFIYIIESSLLVSNYAIRGENQLFTQENFPIWQNDFFPETYKECNRFSHILDFDALRLGKKVVEENVNSGSFEFGVVVITEIGKERGNNLELKEVKKKTEGTNQKNDLFNSWLKMCRHSATVDNYPFIKVFTDEQRPESWGADARDLADIITIVSSGDQMLTLPFYTIEQMLYEWFFNKFIHLYYKFRYIRGDNTLLIHIIKTITAKLFQHNLRMYNQYGYCVLRVNKEDGRMNGKLQKCKYYVMNKKIYSKRFSTDCFSDYFNDLASQTNVGLNDYLTYESEKASIDELRKQHSYFIGSLYDKTK